jgi:hypothetical protein
MRTQVLAQFGADEIVIAIRNLATVAGFVIGRTTKLDFEIQLPAAPSVP